MDTLLVEFLIKTLFAVVGIAVGVSVGEWALNKRKMSTTSALILAVATGRIALTITDAIVKVLLQ